MMRVDFRRDDPAAHRYRRISIVKKTLILGLALLAAAGVALSAAADNGNVLGLWATAPTEKGQAHVKITEEDGVYTGEIVWLEKPTYDEAEGPEWSGKTKVDRKNPKKALQDKPIIGLQIVQGMKAKSESTWDGGTIYDPENGKTYKAKMSLEGDTLKVRGFIGFSLLGRTSVWTRVQE